MLHLDQPLTSQSKMESKYYSLTVISFGGLNCGCNNDNTLINNNIIGLSNQSSYIHLIGTSNINGIIHKSNEILSNSIL